MGLGKTIRIPPCVAAESRWPSGHDGRIFPLADVPEVIGARKGAREIKKD
jgi:hypothetical protein